MVFNMAMCPHEKFHNGFVKQNNTRHKSFDLLTM